MVTRDPETGQFTDGDGHEDMDDYTDYSYENIQVIFNAAGVANDAEQAVLKSWDPLLNRGGLESDEVAELVAYRMEIDWYPYNLASAATENNDPGGYRFDSTFGINLGGNDAPFSTNTDSFTGDFDIVEDKDNIGEASLYVDGNVVDDPGCLQTLTSAGQPQFVDDANGHSGGGNTAHESESMNFRKELGRGPIVDPTDDLTLIMQYVNSRQEYNIQNITGLELVWDIATVDDSRRKFALP